MTLTIFGVIVLTFMMLMYAMERRGPTFILALALRVCSVEHLRVSFRCVAVRVCRGDLDRHRCRALSNRNEHE